MVEDKFSTNIIKATQDDIETISIFFFSIFFSLIAWYCVSEYFAKKNATKLDLFEKGETLICEKNFYTDILVNKQSFKIRYDNLNFIDLENKIAISINSCR